MGVPMRMRCDNCGYDFVGRLNYSDQRRGDMIRCKACDYEVPVISDEEIAAVEATLNKERNWGIYALVAWAAFFVAVVVLGISYFWQVGAGLGGKDGAKNEEVLWIQRDQTALYLKANVTANDQHQVVNSAMIGSYATADEAATQSKNLNDKLKAISDKLAGVGESIDSLLTHNATFDDKGLMLTPNTFDQKFGQYFSGDSPTAPPGSEFEKIEDPATKTAFYQLTKGEEYTFKTTLPDGSTADVPMTLFVNIASRPVPPGREDKPQILASAELRYNEGEITMVVDAFSKQIIRTEVQRTTSGEDPQTAAAVVFGRGLVNSLPMSAAGFKPAKDTGPTGVQLGMMVLIFFSLVAALAFGWLGNKARYTMQLGFVDKEAEAAAQADAVQDEDGDIGGGEVEGAAPLEDNQATAKMDDDIEIS